jgi:asparagine synthase (glutamine-hydrolysing)
MCGISGIVGGRVEPAEVERMVAVQRHRGPDGSGIALLADGAVGLGHNRLSIVDLSDTGRQPMTDADGHRTIVYNGEIYNHVELREELAGYPFRGRSDTEVILAAYARWGEACVERFVGMFAFALWDDARRVLFCARDRLGVKPFHYARHGGRFLFASEIKALLAAGVSREPDLDSWARYLVHGEYEAGDRTFFCGIASLPAGHVMLVRPDGTGEQRRYWSLPERTAEPLELSEDEAAERVDALLTNAVRLRLRADVPVGVNLSGGIDSAALMCAADRLLPDGGAIQTFTGGFGDPRYDEDDFSAMVPRQARWQRHRVTLTVEEVPALAEAALRAQEAPYGGLATLLYHRVHAAAQARDVKVLMEGQGGDELFAGYAHLRPHRYLDILAQSGRSALRRALRHEREPARMLEAMRAIRAGTTAAYTDGTAHLRPDCVAGEMRRCAETRPAWPAPYRERLANAQYRDLCHAKLPRVLRMVDRLSMAHGCELRAPFLDHRLVELAFRLPGAVKIGDGLGKQVLRRVLARRVPALLAHAPKRAVVTPQREWLAGPLAGFVEAIIHSRSFRERGLFDARAVAAAWAEFRRGGSENSFHVWQWVNTELWFRTFDRAPLQAQRAAAVAATAH